MTFGPFRLDPVRHVLLEGDKLLRLGSRALEILIVLAERTGQVVSKNELLARVWPKSVVQEATLRVHIAALRKALGDCEHGTRYVENFSGRGYRFVAPVIRRQEHFPPAPPHEPALSSMADGATHRAESVPVPLTSMIGRGQTVATLVARTPQRRFVTIAGPGGVGKSVVAAAVAERLTTAYEHGVCFVDLSELTNPRELAAYLSAALDVATGEKDPMPAVLSFLKNKSILIVLDNCEHVVEATATVSEKLLQSAPGVHILATSREPLRAEGEFVHRLPPLETPVPSATLSRAEALTFPAIQLFCERAAANLDSFVLQDPDIAFVAEICWRLEGNPFAIELAAARVDPFGVRGVAARLNDSLRLLTRGRRTALPRHQSLRATLDWSYKLLSPLEQVVMRSVAVFSSSFDMETASAVMEDEDISTTEVLDILTNLVAKSLLTADMAGERMLYRMPDVTRAYGLEKLHQSQELARTTRQHSEMWRGAPALSAAQRV